MKSILIIGMILGIILFIGVIGGGLYYYLNLSKGGVDNVEATSEDGFASLSATFYDFSGTPVSGGVSQALIGGTSRRTHVKFDLKASNTGNANLENVRPTSPNTNMNNAFANVVPLVSLTTTQSGVLVGTTAQSCTNGLDSSCNTNEQCCNSTSCTKPLSGNSADFKCFISLNQYASADANTQKFVPFCISLTADYFSASGQPLTITSSQVCIPDSTGYDIRGENCTDGTAMLTCVNSRTGLDSDKPKYCNFIEGSVPNLVDKASLCGCPLGQQPSGDSCVPLACSDGTQLNSCSSSSAGSGCTADGIGSYCKCVLESSVAVLKPDYCNTCDCSPDYYENEALGCSTTSDPSTCNYQTYTGGLSGTLAE